MARRARVESSGAGCGWRVLQAAGFAAMAGGIAMMLMAPDPKVAAGSVVVSAAGAAVYFAARGLAWLIHG